MAASLGYWDVGIPPSGPMDALGLRLANRCVGNAEHAAALEITVSGPTLRFRSAALIALAGAPLHATLDGTPLEPYTPIEVRAGQTLKLGSARVPRGAWRLRHSTLLGQSFHVHTRWLRRT